jgi:hypothetical protein
MPDFPVSSQSGTGMKKKTNDAGTGTVPDLPECRCRNANAGVSFLNADKGSAALDDAS